MSAEPFIQRAFKTKGMTIQAEIFDTERGMTTYLVGIKEDTVSVISVAEAIKKLKTYGFVEEAILVEPDQLVSVCKDLGFKKFKPTVAIWLKRKGADDA